MKIALTAILAAIPLGLVPVMAIAAEPMVFPAKGQNADQQQLDQIYCKGWAQQQLEQSATANQPPPREGEGVRGGARGAAGGAAIGAIAGEAGKGAAAGAIAGGLAGRARRRNAEEQQAAQVGDAYNRAFSACMESKGYTVK